MKRHMENFFRRQLWLRRVCYGLLVLAAAAILALMSFQPVQVKSPDRSTHNLPSDMIPASWQQQGTTRTRTEKLQIEEVINYGPEVLCLVRVPAKFAFPNKQGLECRYGSALPHQKVLAVHHLRPFLATVVCAAPPETAARGLATELLTSVRIKLDRNQEIRPANGLAPLQWNATKVVYEVFPTEQDVAIFVHGFNQTLGYELSQFQCVYGDGGELATAVTAQAYEVFRCGHPPKAMISTFASKKISLRFDGELLPSVAYYSPPPPQQPSRAQERRHHVCACTMLRNGAKFLREWVYYHSHLGVAKFILYDNNSDDNLDEVIASLASFNVSKQSWPWVKTQEAALSHCSLSAAPECTWMLFADVDEYFFPSERFLSPNASSHASVLATFIQDTVASRAKDLAKDGPNAGPNEGPNESPEDGTEVVGQISTYCRNFGPSGLGVSPAEGVTQGYTCRLRRQMRHKSLVLVSAIADSLGNQVHHFSLKPAFVTEVVRPWVAIVNHYKFQAWDEFKAKFHRRAATYVADWSEDRNHGSNDRVPGLGTKPVKPADWESRYCEVQDYGLRNYTRRVFGSPGQGGKLHMAWE